MTHSVTLDAKISYVNKTWKNVLGYSDRDIKKLSLWGIICKSEHAHCKKLFKKVMSGNSLDLINTIFISKSGKKIPVSGTAHPILKNGKVIATDAIFWETKR
jgi:PAS domain S-box-containing protein